MDQPDGFTDGEFSYKWLLKRALYGLKQAPREWNEKLHNFLIEIGYVQSKRDPCIYHKGINDDKILLGIFVDDILSTSKNETLLNEFRSALKSRFKYSQGERLNWCLGIEIKQTNQGIYINQQNYINLKLEEFKEH
jgi:hypothetical protein